MWWNVNYWSQYSLNKEFRKIFGFLSSWIIYYTTRNIISSPKVLFLSDQEYKEHFIPKGKGLEIKCTHIKYTQTYIFSQAKCTVHVQTKIKMYIYNQENLWPGLKHSKYFLPWPKGCCIFCLHFVVIIWKYLRHMEWALRALSCFL